MVSKTRANLHAKAIASTHPGRHSQSPEPTTASGVRPGHAPLDSPQGGSEPTGIVSGSRNRKSTERISGHVNSIAARDNRSEKWKATHNYNQGKLEASQQSGAVRGRPTNIRPLGSTPKSKPHSKSRSRANVRVQAPNTKADQAQQQSRQQDLKRIARSPSPGSSDIEPADSTQRAKAHCDSQYTYVWEDVGYETLLGYAEARLGYDVEGWTEDQILEKLDVLEGYKAPPMANPREHSSVVVLAPTPIAVGGGWHGTKQLARDDKAMALHSAKRAADDDITGGQATIKRIRMGDPENTDTEPESDNEPVAATSGLPPPPAPPAPPSVRIEASQPVAPVLQRQSTSTTMPETALEGQTTSSPSLGGSPALHVSPLPRLVSPFNLPRGPVHARLQSRMAVRNFVRDLATQDLGLEPEGDQPNDEELPSSLLQDAPAPPITYAGYRSHLDPPDDTHSLPVLPPAMKQPQPQSRIQRSSRTEPTSILEHLELSHTVENAVRNMIHAGRAEANQRSRIRPRRTNPTSQPKTSVQKTSSASNRGQKKRSRRLDPVASARADMAQFNEQCARDNAISFVQSVTRQNERTGRSALREGEVRSPHELLQDNEEDLAHDEALRASKVPAGCRKKKPQARDFHGLQRQILTLAKLHLFAFALSEGIYQTRATFMLWASLVHEATWEMELPNVPYAAATTEELEVMVNYIATLRGKIKDRVRPVVSHAAGFNECAVTQQDLQDNIDIFNELCPNSFHCMKTRPRRGHYENILLARCIAAAFFYGPNSVGVLFPDYFEDMAVTIVAFTLAIMQFCLEEWANGYFVSRDLGAANMLDKFEAHLTGLKELRKVAPRRLQKLQNAWFEYASEYSGATFVRDVEHAEASRSEFRPDTPPPQESQVGAESEDDGLYTSSFPDNQRATTPNNAESRTPTPPPVVEYNEHGCRTARSNGKDRA